MKNLTSKYTFLHINYWAIYSALSGFTAVYMMALGMKASQIGIAMACSSIFSSIVQPPLATFADSTRKFTIRNITIFIAALGLLMVIRLNIVPGSRSTKAVMFVSSMALTNIMLPLINSISVYYNNRGQYINYGLSRGIGSFSYAVMSYILGYTVRMFGEGTITLTALILYIILIIAIMQFKMPKKSSDMVSEMASEGNENNENKQNFFIKHKRYMLLLFGVVFSFSFHSMTNTYMIQIMEMLGGDSRQMGISVALAAALELPTMMLFSRIVKRINSANLMKIAALSFFIKSVIFFMAGSVFAIYAGQIMQMFSFALFIPASVYYANLIMDEKDKVKGQAFMTTSFTLSGVLGNLLGGYLIDIIGVHNMMGVSVSFALIGFIIVSMGADSRKENEIMKSEGLN